MSERRRGRKEGMYSVEGVLQSSVFVRMSVTMEWRVREKAYIKYGAKSEKHKKL